MTTDPSIRQSVEEQYQRLMGRLKNKEILPSDLVREVNRRAREAALRAGHPDLWYEYLPEPLKVIPYGHTPAKEA